MNTVQPEITASRLTAPGRGAVASIRLQCGSAEQAPVINESFAAANGKDPATAPVNRVLFGSWRGEDVVLVRTAELEWEVHCHGGEAAVTRILREFRANEAATDRVSPFESLLIRTRTPMTARLALAQANGLLDVSLRAAAACHNVAEFRKHLEELLRWESVAQHLDTPWRIVIAGPPNVGKSSLLNAIAGYERAIVFDQPGTTRDAVQTELVLDGWPFCFVDTAGIRQQSDDPIEQEGIRNARRLLDTADLILLAVDHSIGWKTEHRDMLNRIPETTPHAVVICKSDLTPHGEPVPEALPVLATSSESGQGIRELTSWTCRRLIPEKPTLETALPVAGSAELCQSLLRQLEGGTEPKTVQNELWNWIATSQPK